MARFVDLSHPIEDGGPAYPGLPGPRVEAHLTREASRARYAHLAEFEIDIVELVGNTGTYLDSPYHRYAGREDIGQLDLARLAGVRGFCVEAVPAATGGRDVSVALPRDADLAGAAVLVRTGWSDRWGTDAYWEPGPFLAPAALDAFLAARVGMVGVDFWNVDDTTDPARPAHTRLLDAGILLVEHLAGLASLPPSGFRFFAVPPPIRGAASFPVRAFAELAGPTDDGGPTRT